MAKKKKTMKDKVLAFVEKRGEARYTDIIKFIVDTKFGKGTYDSGRQPETIYEYDYLLRKHVPKVRMRNRWRGYYAAAFSGKKPYLLIGPSFLVKGVDGLYRVNNYDEADTIISNEALEIAEAALSNYRESFFKSMENLGFIAEDNSEEEERISFEDVKYHMRDWSANECLDAIEHLAAVIRNRS
jgi:hypothetical protein